MENLTEFEDANGNCYIDLTKVLAVSGPMQAKQNPESRKVVLPGYVIYILNNEANCKKLGIGYYSIAAQPKPKKPRTRKPGYFRRGAAPEAGQ